jgi:hypothetical protein
MIRYRQPISILQVIINNTFLALYCKFPSIIFSDIINLLVPPSALDAQHAIAGNPYFKIILPF